MKIVLYNNLSDNIVINKTIEQAATLNNALLLDKCSVVNPTLIVENTASALYSNYVRIPDFGRYYYIVNRTILDAKRISLDCKVDVLVSYSDNILSSKQIVTRQEFRSNSYLEDPGITALSKPNRQVLQFTKTADSQLLANPTGTTGYKYVLNTF